MNITFFLVWIVLIIVVGIVAKNKNRNVGNWVGGAILFAPIILLILLALPKLEKEVPGVSKKCPFCAELIKNDAKVCRYCSRELPSEEQIHEKTCYYCKRQIPIDSKFCTFCGKELPA